MRWVFYMSSFACGSFYPLTAGLGDWSKVLNKTVLLVREERRGAQDNRADTSATCTAVRR